MQVVLDAEPHHAAHRDVAVVDVGVQRVRDHHPFAVGDDVFDLVPQPRHRCEEARHAAGVLVAPDASAAERRRVLVDEVVADVGDDGSWVTGCERREVGGAALGGGHPATEPQTSCAFSYTPWS